MYETPLHKKYGTFSFLPISLAQLIISETSGSHIIVNCVSILELLPVQTSNTQRASHVASDLGEAVHRGRWTKEIHEASRADFLRLQGQPGFNKLSAGLQAWNFTRPLHSPFGEGKPSPVVAGERMPARRQVLRATLGVTSPVVSHAPLTPPWDLQVAEMGIG